MKHFQSRLQYEGFEQLTRFLSLNLADFKKCRVKSEKTESYPSVKRPASLLHPTHYPSCIYLLWVSARLSPNALREAEKGTEKARNGEKKLCKKHTHYLQLII